MSKGNPNILRVDELEKLTTPRLLAYRNSLYKVNEGPSYEETIYGGKDFSTHKQSPKWKSAMADVKSVLDTREHLDRSQKEETNGC